MSKYACTYFNRNVTKISSNFYIVFLHIILAAYLKMRKYILMPAAHTHTHVYICVHMADKKWANA